MKNITVSIDEETHLKARIRAAELGTSVSALVRGYLNTLCAKSAEAQDALPERQDAELKKRSKLLDELFAEWDAKGIGVKTSENLTRDELYDHRSQDLNALR